MDSNFLQIGSLIALIMRAVAVLIFAVVLVKQFHIFKRPNSYKTESKIKWLLFSLVFLILVSNVPILYIHYERVLGLQASNDVTAVATIFNAVATLLAAIIFYVIYSDRDDGRDSY